jgi:DUF3047 family protein
MRRSGRSKRFSASVEAAAVALALAVRMAIADAPPPLEVGRFSALPEPGPLPAEWCPLEFKKIPSRTDYALARSDGRVVIRATSRASASGLVRTIRIDTRQYPIVAWSWKVSNLIDKGDVRKKSGDDYPARIYITFEYDPARVGLLERAKFGVLARLYGEYPPIAAINYIWESRAPLGEIVPNAFTSRVRMIVVESGPAKVGRWVEERRDVLADYRAAFGEDPPAISGVAIMTDTDNTGEAAVAEYGDITFFPR